MTIAVAESRSRCHSGRTVGHCGWNAVGRAAYIVLARCAVICARAALARRTDEKTTKLDAVPICRHEIPAAANTQHDVVRHPRPPYATQTA